MKRSKFQIIVALLLSTLILSCVSMKVEDKETKERPVIQLVDARNNRLETLAIGTNLTVSAKGLSPGHTYEILLRDESGTYVSMLRQTADMHGSLAPQVLWYQSGVVGCGKGTEPHLKLPYRFKTFEEAEKKLDGTKFVIELLDRKTEIAKHIFPFSVNRKSVVYFSDANGCLMNSADGKEDIFIKGRNFLPGSIIELFLVPNQYEWHVGDRIQPIRRLKEPHRVRLTGEQTSFVAPLWRHNDLLVGTYDVIARSFQTGSDKAIDDFVHHRDVIGWDGDVGIVVYDASETHLVEQIAGRRIFTYPWFKHVDGFPLGTNVWGALDPKRKPTGHTGTYAAWYVVNHKNLWTNGDVLNDVSGGPPEITPIKPGCINHTWTLLWASPMPANVNEANPTRPYDIVIDFGNMASDSGSFLSDGVYTEETDFVDYRGAVGFYLVRDPILNGSFQTADKEESFGCDTNLDGITINWTDPSFYGASTFSVAIGDDDNGSEDGRCPSNENMVDMRAHVYYPQKPGTTDVADGWPFPVVVFYHGQQWPWNIPGYEGYAYLGNLLASHGFIAYSIDARSLLNATISSRGEHIRAHMRKLVSLNASGSGSVFSQKMDLQKVALVGHSRGGEAVVAAWEWQRVQADSGYAFKAIISIAPVQFFNQNKWFSPEPNFEQHMRDIPYMIIHGSKDGDVSDFQGLRLYDRAADIRQPGQTPKAMVFVKDANHNFFNTIWETGDDYCCGGVISGAEQQSTAQVYIHSFLQAFLKNHPEYLNYFTGVIPYPGLATVATDYRSPAAEHTSVDHHEVIAQASHDKTENSACVPAGCGNVNVTGITDYEERLLAVSAGIPWSSYPGETYGASLSWDSSTDTYYTEIPTTVLSGVDTSIQSQLSFRVAQVYRSSSSPNPSGMNQNFAVRLRDTDLDFSPWVYVADFATIYPPWQTSEGGIKTVMSIVRIPLQVFTVNTYSLLDLNKIDRIEFVFRGTAAGEIVFDDIEFTQ